MTTRRELGPEDRELKVQLAPKAVTNIDNTYYRFDPRLMSIGDMYRVKMGDADWVVTRDEHGRLEFRRSAKEA